MPVCRQASIRAGIPTIPPAMENDFRPGCVSLLVRGSIWRCRGSLWRSLPGLIATHLAFGLWPLFGIFTIPMPVCQRAGRQAQGQADWQAGEQAGGQECLRIRKHIDYKHEELFFTCAKCSLVDILAHSSIAFQQFLCLAGLCSLAFPRSNACMPACRQAGTRASRLTGRQVNWQAGKNAFRFANLKTDRQATMFFSLAWQHLALSWQLVAFLSRISDLENTLPLHPSGRAKPKARTADPGSVLLLGSRKVSGDRCLING